jgi:hypothetical protein
MPEWPNVSNKAEEREEEREAEAANNSFEFRVEHAHIQRTGLNMVGLVFALRPQTPKHIRGGWSHYTDTSEPVEVMGLKIWSLSNPGLEPPTFRSLVQRANHCTNRAHYRSEQKIVPITS